LLTTGGEPTGEEGIELKKLRIRIEKNMENTSNIRRNDNVIILYNKFIVTSTGKIKLIKLCNEVEKRRNAPYSRQDIVPDFSSGSPHGQIARRICVSR
jgi:hypothetical protein